MTVDKASRSNSDSDLTAVLVIPAGRWRYKINFRYGEWLEMSDGRQVWGRRRAHRRARRELRRARREREYRDRAEVVSD